VNPGVSLTLNAVLTSDAQANGSGNSGTAESAVETTDITVEPIS